MKSRGKISDARKVALKEVKMHFLLADAFKEIVEQNGIPIYPSKLDFEKSYKRFLSRYSRYSEAELDQQIEERDPLRLERYNALEWYHGQVNLRDTGSWPGMDGLDVKLTTGNLPETVRRVRKVWDRKSDLKIPEHFREKIESIVSFRDLVLPRFPIILIPGGVERGNHNNWVKTEGVREGEVPEAEQNDWLCKIFIYDIEAGNSRAFAYCHSGLKKVSTYFGKQRI